MNNLLFPILIPQFFIHNAAGKECTDMPTQHASHTLQAQLFSSSHQHHLTPTDDTAWSSLRPGENLEESLDWEIMYRKIKYSNGNVNESGRFLKEVSLHDVRLDPDSFHGSAQQTNLEYLLLLDVDSLAWAFRNTAGLPTPGKPYGGWEAPNCELRGHFVGHYLSSTAQMWASTHNPKLYDKMNRLVSTLYECQRKIGTGYLSAFPTEEFDRVEAIKPVWAPYYTIHKIMAGLLDQYSLGGTSQALKMVVWMADYFSLRVQNVILKYTIEKHYASLNTESGGMNDVFYRLYSITGNHKYFVLGTLFDKPCFIGGLALQTDSLSGFHANTHIPILIGTQIRYELTSDPIYKAIGTYFMNVVNSSHCYATGGTSVSEHWSDPKRLASTLQAENEESCTTYNMLKVSRHLFRWTKEMSYADYYERALTNGVLSIQRGREPGVMIYMLPLGRGESKARSHHGWGTKFDSFWCCYGTGIESFSKLGDSIYFEGGDREVVYIVQYISSSFNWRAGGIMINQKAQPVVSWDPVLRVTFNFSANTIRRKSSTLKLRIPLWTDTNGAFAKLNGIKLFPPAPGSFLSIYRNWSSGDNLSLELPMKIWTEAIKDDRPEFSSVRAIFYGPYLLAGLSDGDWDLKTGPSTSPSDWITAVRPFDNSQLITLYQQSSNGTNFVVTSSNTAITMAVEPEPGTDAAVQATFRVVYKDVNSSSPSPSEHIFLEKEIMIEPFNLPGMTVVQLQRGQNIELQVVNAEGTMELSMFRMVRGLDRNETVSLESESHKGCFLYSGVLDYNGRTKLTVRCHSGSDDADFQRATSFNLRKGLGEYHPLTFVATGVRRNFLLMPLFSLRDESYTVYFNMDA